MSYSIHVTAQKKDFKEKLDEAIEADKEQRSEESNKQLDIAKEVIQKQLEIAENEEDVVTLIAHGHAGGGHVNGRIEFGIIPAK